MGTYFNSGFNIKHPLNAYTVDYILQLSSTVPCHFEVSHIIVEIVYYILVNYNINGIEWRT